VANEGNHDASCARAGDTKIKGGFLIKMAPPYDTTAFELSYEPSDEQKPTVGALVFYVSDGWTLPGPVGDFARAIEIKAFAVRVGKVNEVQVAVAALQGSWTTFTISLESKPKRQPTLSTPREARFRAHG
jgi:hypothetical protein